MLVYGALVFVAMFVVVGGASLVTDWLGGRRRRDLQAWANDKGFYFEAEHDVSTLILEAHVASPLHVLPPAALNFVRGELEGTPVWIFDLLYSFTPSTGSSFLRSRSLDDVHQTTCVLTLPPGVTAPAFHAAARAAGVRLAPSPDLVDVGVSEDVAFSKAVKIQTKADVEQVRRFLSRKLRQAILERKVEVEVAGDKLLVHRGRVLSVEHLDQLIDDARALRHLMQ